MLTFYIIKHFVSILLSKQCFILLYCSVLRFYNMERVLISLMLVMAVTVKGDVTHGMYTNRNFQVPWDGPPVYNHTTTTAKPEAIIELSIREQVPPTTTTAPPPDQDASTKESGTTDFKLPGEENYFKIY